MTCRLVPQHRRVRHRGVNDQFFHQVHANSREPSTPTYVPGFVFSTATRSARARRTERERAPSVRTPRSRRWCCRHAKDTKNAKHANECAEQCGANVGNNSVGDTNADRRCKGGEQTVFVSQQAVFSSQFAESHISCGWQCHR